MSDSFATVWTTAHQAFLSMGLFRQEYWSGLPFPPPEDLPNPGIEPASPALAHGFFITEPPAKQIDRYEIYMKWKGKLLSRVWLFVTPWIVHGVLQARKLEGVAFFFSRASSQPRDGTRSPTLWEDSLPAKPQGKPKNTGVGSLSLLQGIFPDSGIELGSPGGEFFTNWVIREYIDT